MSTLCKGGQCWRKEVESVSLNPGLQGQRGAFVKEMEGAIVRVRRVDNRQG
jgi:hypothetical protein